MGLLDKIGDVIGGVVSPITDLATGYLGNRQARKAQKSQYNYDKWFAEQMANTAVQRRAQDLIQAGINPMLAGIEGASAPAMSSIGVPVWQGSELTDDYNSARMMKKQMQQIDNDIENKTRDSLNYAALTGAQKDLLDMQTTSAFLDSEAKRAMLPSIRLQGIIAEKKAKLDKEFWDDPWFLGTYGVGQYWNNISNGGKLSFPNSHSSRTLPSQNQNKTGGKSNDYSESEFGRGSKK